MRVLGIILLIAGILMIVFNGVNFQTEKKVADIGPVEINKKETRHVGWPAYAGGIAALAGVVILVSANRKS